MKRAGQLWDRLIGFENLHRAAQNAARGKRHRPDVAAFRFGIERELCKLQDELHAKAYRPGGYRTFQVYEPKKRLISAAPFRDRVVHHALCQVLEPVFEPAFISDSYACRKGKGTHAAVDRFTEFVRGNRFVLKCDVSKFFPSVDHGILKSLVRRKIKDDRVMWLVDRIIDGSNRQEPVTDWFFGDSLFAPLEHRRGLPIGNQTSQFFANVYLNPLDHFVKQTPRFRSYVRYVDDFVLLAGDTSILDDARDACREFLRSLRLKMHPRKCSISRVEDGTPFLGYRVFPTHRFLCRENVIGMRRRLRRMQRGYAQGLLSPSDIRQRLMAWIGHAGHANTWRLRARLFRETSFVRTVR